MQIIFKRKFLYLQSNLKAFNPFNSSIISWDFLILFLIILEFIHIPIKVFFNLKKDCYSEFLYFLFISFPILIFTLDIFINLNKGFYKKGRIIENRNKIAKKYFKEKFFSNFLTLGSFIIFENYYELRYFQLFFFFKVFDLLKYFKKLEKVLNFKEKGKGIFYLAKLTIIVFIVAHIFSCLWYFIGEF